MGRTYPLIGVMPPLNWVPKTGDVVYIEGKRTTLGPITEDGLFIFRPAVRGTTAMSSNNLRQVARLEASPVTVR